ncbi:hypothetical protein V6N12_035419 [Hibiscus sabdariffa]|uniref:Uncharacterized protein n=1 Tax=Hibiscus sabdariffa TaxID=183260 RepID=A0ABR2EPG1_9ROSI
MMLDASANGTLIDKPPREGLEILEKLAQNDYQHPTTRRGTMRRGIAQLDSSDTILAQISTLTNMVKNLQKQHAIHEVKKCNDKHIQPSMEEASKRLLAKSEQHPKSQNFNSAGIPKSAKAESAAEPAKNRDDDAKPRSCPQISGKPSWADIPNTTTSVEEDDNIPIESEEAEREATPQPRQPKKDTLEEPRPPPPFLQRLEKKK